jgi:transposase
MGAVNLIRHVLTLALFSPERSNVQTANRRRIVEHYRNALAPAEAAAQEESRPLARHFQSSGADGDRVCAAFRDPVADAAQGNGLRFWEHLLATTRGMAASQGVGSAAPSTAVEASRGRANRLLSRGGRQFFDPRPGSWKKTGPNPTDRRRPGSKHHILTDAKGIPLSVILTKANRNDVTQLLPLVQAIPPIAGKPGRPQRKPELVQADRGYDSNPHRAALKARGIQSQIARRRTKHGSGLGKTRWVVERTIAWLHWFRRLRIRYERLPRIHEAFLKIGCALICWRQLQHQGSF